jgi:anti-sigma factor ChrR (cupin superfamily)
MHSHPHDEADERVALYALGALTDAERDDFESHLGGGCARCRAEVDTFNRVTARLGELAPVRRPRAELRTAVLAAVDQVAAEPAVTELEGIRFVRAARVPWQMSTVPAVQVKQLAKDPQRGYHSVLVRMPPGSSYPQHRHADVEEVYVLEGDLTVNGVMMHAGDYCRAEAGSVHRDVFSEHGCTYIVFASVRDEFVA